MLYYAIYCFISLNKACFHFTFRYHFTTCTHTPSSNNGGAGLFISNNVVYKPRNDLNKMLFSSKSLESVFIEIIFKHKKNIIVGCIYKHPHMDVSDFNSFYLSPLLSKISSENKGLVLLGDFNINLLQFDSHSAYSELFLIFLGPFR